LANRQEQQLSRLVKKLRDAEQQLEQIRQQQDGLQKKLERLTKQSQQPGANQAEIKQQLERLQREQRKLQQETERLAKQLQRLQAEKAAQSTAGAASEMNRADKDAAQGKQPDALDDLAKAKQDLDEAQQQLAERRRQAEQELAHEQLAKIGDALKSLADRQSRIVDETLAYDAQRKQPTGLTRAQSQSVLDLGRTEASLSAESTALAEKVAAAEVFQLALEQAAAEMNGAADRLAQLDTGSATQLVAGNALRRLQQIVEALRRDPNSNPPQPNDGGRGREGGGAGGAGNQPPADKIALLAEVKLLKMLQEQVNLRTKQLDEATRGQPMLTADQRREYIELAREQGNLAELIAKKSAPPAAPPEEIPESLPDTT
jgi:chromosome segregation ATPase